MRRSMLVTRRAGEGADRAPARVPGRRAGALALGAALAAAVAPAGSAVASHSCTTAGGTTMAAFDDRLRARPGARVTLRYVTTVPTAVELVVRRGRRTVARIG